MASKKFDDSTFDSKTFDSGSTAAPPSLAISNIVVSSITSSGATITWDTNIVADSQVDYGLTSSYGSSSTLDATMVTSHSVVLTGLSGSTTYHYRVKSRDSGGNLVTSSDATFVTLAGEVVLPPGILKLTSGANDWTDRCLWKDYKFSFRKGVGVAASFSLDTTDVINLAPGCEDEFKLVLPTGEIFIMVPVGEPTTLYRQDAHSLSTIDTVHTYDLIDIVSALDRVPLPAMQFIESNAGEIITTIASALNPAIDTSGVVTGNSVPYLDTADFAKFSDIVKHASIQTGGYTVQIDPNTHGGYAMKGNYDDSFGASGISIDKDTIYSEGVSVDFTPQKDQIEPDNNIINVQRVKSTKPGPHHTVCEFREFDAFESSFKLKTLPYGLDGAELLNFQIDGGSISGADASGLPKILPIHYPVQVEVADITLGGSGEICGFVGRGGVTVLSLLVSGSSIGAKVSGASYTASTPFVAGGHAPDTDHQYYYDYYAAFSAGGLIVTITENYLNNLAGQTPLATVTSVNQSTGVIGITLTSGTLADLPTSVRFFNPSDPTDIRGFSTILDRSAGTLTIDNLPKTVIVGDRLASGDSATVTVTDQVVYNGAAPSNRYGKPQLIISGGSGITARQWVASYGPPVDITLLPNTYTGAPGRKLKVGTSSSKSADIAISASGNTAVCTFIGDRLPLRGDIQLIINYDAAKIIDVTVQDIPSQGRCGIRQGDIIESDAVLTTAEATALGQSVLDEFADPKPKGTIQRESWLTTRFPLPNETVPIDVPTQYMITAADTQISSISIDFGGYDWLTNEGILIYHIEVGAIDAREAIDRQLLANQTALGLEFRPLSAPGARISSASWNDTNLVTLGVSGSVALNGKAASASFDPADYATGNLREAPVTLAGTITSGGVVGELLVEVIYPPLDIDAASETCTYSPRTNLITYRWGRPSGAQEYWVKRLVDDGTGTHTLVFKQVDKIFNESYQLPYEPESKAVEILTIGLADKKGAGGYIHLECTLPQLPALTTFQIVPGKAVKPSGRIPFLCSAPPAIVSGIDYTHRVEFLRILLTKTPVHTPPTVRADFVNTDVNLVTVNIPMQGITEATRQPVYYEEFEPGESVWAIAIWVDKFGDEGLITVPFDVLHPPVTAGYIDLADFFQSATQANGGSVADDDEVTPGVEFTGKYRIHLGNHNAGLKLWFDESLPIIAGGTYPADALVQSHGQDITDQDVLNGYADIIMKQKFRWTKKKQRKYRPDTITFIGPNIRVRNDATGTAQNTHEKRFLVGYTGSPPPIVPHQVDAVFDKSLFEFLPGIAGLGNTFTIVTGVSVTPKPEAVKVRWDRFADDASIRRYLILIHTAPFGTRGPGNDATMGGDLSAITTAGTILVYESTNTNRNTTVSILDAGDTGHHTFQNGDVIGGLTISSGTTYYVAVIAQLQNGRYSSDFSTVVSSVAGGASGGEDAADAGAVVGLSMLPWSPKKGWRAIWQPPTTFYNAPRGYIISYYVTVSGTTYWMNPETGAILSQVAGAATTDERVLGNTGGIQVYIRVDDTRHTTGIALSDASLDNIFKVNGVKARVRAVNRQSGGDTISGNSSETATVLPTVDSTTPAPGQLAFPAAPSTADNTVDGDPDKNEARVDITFATSNVPTPLSFTANSISRIELVYTRTSNGVVTGSPSSEVIAIPAASLSASSYKHSFYFRLGQSYRITEVIAWNGDRRTSTTGVLDFVAGNVRTVDPTDAQIVPTPLFGTVTREDGSNKIDLVPISLTQPSGVVIWFKKIVVEARVNTGTWATEQKIGLKAEDSLHVPGGVYSETIRIKRKAGVNAEYRMLAYAVGGKASGSPPGTFTSGQNLISVGATTQDIVYDTIQPGAFTLNFAKFKKNGFITIFTAPTVQMATHYKTVLVLHDNGESTSFPGTIMYFNPVTATWVFSGTLPNNEIEFGKGGIPSLPLTKSEVYVDGRTNLYVKVGLYNAIGSTYSNTLVVTSTNAENTAPTDQTVPDPPPAPIIKEQYGSIILKAKVPSIGGNLVNKWQYAVTNVNNPPSTADPPQPPSGNTVFAYDEGADGVHKWTVQYQNVLPNTRYFWVRCKNVNNPTTGGPGLNGWSNWSLPTAFVLSNVTRPLQDEIGSGPPNVLGGGTGNAVGYLDVQGTQNTGVFLPLNVYDTYDATQPTAGAELIYEFLLPTDETAFSLTTVQWEFYKVNGVKKAAGSFVPSTTSVLRLPLPSFNSTFRFRIRNKYRANGSNGWSNWTNYARRQGSPGLGDYDPGTFVQAESDFMNEGAYPSRYTSL